MQGSFKEYYISTIMSEAPMDLPPPPPAVVRYVGPEVTNITTINKERLKKLETVVACLILEAGGERDPRAMPAVNEVIHNRAKRLPEYNTDKISALYKVVTARKQFSCFNSGVEAGVERAKKHPKWGTAIKILQQPVTNYTNGADHYHVTKMKTPYWVPDLLRKGYTPQNIENHTFYSKRKR